MKTKLLLYFLLFIITATNAQQKIYDFTSYPWNLKIFNDKLIFQASQDDTGREIWQSDGTASNTQLLKDINPGSESSYVYSEGEGSAILNNNFYFIAKDENSAGEIWKTDGTTAGTIKVTNFINGKSSTLTTVGNLIYFLISADDKLQVWKTDGTTVGTVLVKDNLPIADTPSFEGKCSNTFIFTFQPYGTSDSRVWRSDGTSAGTFPITSQIDGNGSDNGGTAALTQYIQHNNKLYFVDRYSLYETDGTLENTKIIGNVWNAQQNLVQYSTVIEANNNLYFMFFSAELNQLSIWKFDAVNSDVTQIYTKTSSKYFSPSNFAKTDDSLIFSTSNETGVTSLISLNLTSFTESSLGELSNNLSKPLLFVDWLHSNNILKINNNEYFISSIDENDFKKGWILDLKLNSIKYISDLDNLLTMVSYGDSLYYSKDNKLWKYSTNLSTPLIGNKSALVFYPNPSTDFINVQSENNEVETVQIFDWNGKLVSNKADFNANKIDITRLNQGAYILKAKVNGTEISKKIIKN